MSRIGKKAVPVPNGVTVTLDGQTVTVKGPKGQLAWTVAEEIEVKQRRKGRNLALGLVLVFFVILFYAITFVKMG